MTGPVMVPLDGSEKDGRALPVAVRLADLSGAGLHLVRVIEPLSKRQAAEAEFLRLDEATVSGRHDAERRMADTADRLAADTKHWVTWEVIEGRQISEELIRHAAERDARVVVMATRAPGTIVFALGGSVADRVMRDCPKPVVVVPPGAAYLGGKHVQFTRVLVPLDGSALAARALEFLLGLPRANELQYVLLEVVPPPEAPVPLAGAPVGEYAAERVVAAEERLRAAAARVRTGGATAIEFRAVEGAEPARAIAAAVREFLVEIIAMSTRGAGGLRRLVLGSVAEGVVRASEVPVLLLTPASLVAAEG